MGQGLGCKFSKLTSKKKQKTHFGFKVSILFVIHLFFIPTIQLFLTFLPKIGKLSLAPTPL
jgi:hypothetical protein